MTATGPSAQESTAAELAALLGGTLVGREDVAIAGVNSLKDAAPHEITFITSRAYAARWSESRAGAAAVNEGLDVPGHDERTRALIVVPNAELAMITLLSHFQPARTMPDAGVHPTAVVHENAIMGDGVRIGPHVSVAEGSRLGDGVVLHAGVRVYEQVQIGDESEIHANCVIRERCVLGQRVTLHPNVTIGADGFGYRPAADGSGIVKVPQIGHVEIGDDVEIGAGSCVDRGKFGATTIGSGTKIDNLVQVGHNCRIGRSCVIAGSTGLAGSVTIGDGATIAGMVGIADHLTIGAGATVAGKSGVTKDVPPGETWCWYPAGPMTSVLRQWAAIRRLPEEARRARGHRAE